MHVPYPPHGLTPWDIPLKAYIDDRDQDNKDYTDFRVNASEAGSTTDAGVADKIENGPLTGAALDAYMERYTYPDLSTLRAETDPLPVGSTILTRDEKYSYVVEPSGSTDYQLVTAGGDKLRVSDGNQVVTPVMFGAVGDGVADDLVAVQACWIWAAERNIPVDMEGLEYNCSEVLTTRSNLTVHGNGAVLYITAWPVVGAFVTNVVQGDSVARIQSNIHIDDLIFDGSKLPAPNSSQNSNLLDFARGASDVRVVNCTARYMRRGYGGGTGGAGFGGEQGLENVIFDGCIIHDCFRGVRVAGLPGAHADAGAQKKKAIGVVFRDLTVKNCWAAIFCHSVGEATGDFVSDLSVFDVLFDDLYIEDCGHAAWSDLDYGAFPSIVPQKSGVVVFGGAQNIRMRGVRVKINSDYTTRADWLGNSGYPAGGTNYTGAGLSGNVGALVWGWGRNIVIEDMALDGVVDCARRLANAVALGEIASTPPGRSDRPNEQNNMSFSHVAGSALAHIVDGWRTAAGVGHDNAYTDEVVTFSTAVAPATAVVSSAAIPSGGFTGITDFQVAFRTFRGKFVIGTAAQWLADPSTSAAISDFVVKGGFDFGGGYSPTGSKNGISYDAANILRSSRDTTSAATHQAFYNPNGLVGSISTNGSATTYATSSDASLKTDLQDFDGIAMLQKMKAYDFEWLVDGTRSFGVIAQEIRDVLPDAVVEDPETGLLGVDYSKFVPILIKAFLQLHDEIQKD